MMPAFVYAAFVSGGVSKDLFFSGLVLVPALLQAWWAPAVFLWNAPAWSLSVELLFYLAFPALIFIGARFRRDVFLLLSVVLVLVVFALRSAVMPLGSQGQFFPLFYFPLFMLGAALGRAFLFGPRLSPQAHTLIFFSALAMLLSVFFLAPSGFWTDGIAAPLFGMLIYGAARPGRSLKWIVSRPLVLLGEASYSIYILHNPVQFWWGQITKRLLGLNLSAFPDFVLYFTVVLTVSVMFYLYAEKPLRRRILGHKEHPDGLTTSSEKSG